MKKNNRYLVLAGIAAAIIVVILIFPKGKNKGDKKAAGPETVVENFNKAIINGDWQEAYSLCDTAEIGGYIEKHIMTREALAISDSTSLTLAERILSGTEISILNTEETDGMCVVTYALTLDENNKKVQKATVKKENGAWKVVRITDRS